MDAVLTAWMMEKVLPTDGFRRGGGYYWKVLRLFLESSWERRCFITGDIRLNYSIINNIGIPDHSVVQPFAQVVNQLLQVLLDELGLLGGVEMAQFLVQVLVIVVQVLVLVVQFRLEPADLFLQNDDFLLDLALLGRLLNAFVLGTQLLVSHLHSLELRVHHIDNYLPLLHLCLDVLHQLRLILPLFEGRGQTLQPHQVLFQLFELQILGLHLFRVITYGGLVLGNYLFSFAAFSSEFCQLFLIGFLLGFDSVPQCFMLLTQLCELGLVAYGNILKLGIEFLELGHFFTQVIVQIREFLHLFQLGAELRVHLLIILLALLRLLLNLFVLLSQFRLKGIIFFGESLQALLQFSYLILRLV